MDREQLSNERDQRRQFMFTEGILDNRFLVIEGIENETPDFVETIMRQYIPSVDNYIQQLQGILIAEPLNVGEMERLICKLKGLSATVGTGRLTAAVGAMLEAFHLCNTDANRLAAALEEVRSQYQILKSWIDPYLEILEQLRGGPPPPVDQDSDDNDEA